ncbi:uncharacterized protein LOC115622188 [Scaptodrosophila lebanonensis]|uniref:Uncharacterized protein LOC115622188 n=1 Tax=Drosophila lebanonensis TaxID=7225 RepID=A0A6J2T7F4_DROLE|nr:uncharacterized protein LOC115622188 [Scaptodrosophila lebanonensis]
MKYLKVFIIAFAVLALIICSSNVDANPTDSDEPIQDRRFRWELSDEDNADPLIEEAYDNDESNSLDSDEPIDEDNDEPIQDRRYRWAFSDEDRADPLDS